MADTKISALPASTTPLAGTEVLPIVQSSATKQVSVANLTAGRAISATQLTLTTGNLIVASGQGVDFSATAGTGTSELLADYEEGIWTPSIGGTATYTTQEGSYTKVGRQVTVRSSLTINVIGTGSTTIMSGLPFSNSIVAVAIVGYFATLATSVVQIGGYINPGTSVNFTSMAAAGTTTSSAAALFGNSARIDFTATYFV